MEIGRLKHRIKIYDQTETVNDEGIFVTDKKLIATPYCEVSKTTIKEFREMGLEARKGTIDFIIRYRQKADIQSDMIVEFKGKEYKIKYIETDLQDLERQMLKCEVTE
ncbi:phage head closure protein [Staphylococcus hominis]|uniref:phage head closure protein n=1 Tax=Staphylococcus hominis TaxID=1290 RepID=UPI002DB5CB55|nr:phage head closure protein [Staphylococcus hominis]MEB5794030.1 phage head closure protein [Staphylococcus hominis]